MSNTDLWKSYKKNPSKEIKDKLIIKYIELVKIIAGRLYSAYNSNVEYEDLLSYGIIGLIDAIEKFDPNKNVKFETYANFRIRGSIIDQLRSLDWIPRSTRQKHKRVEEALQKLQNQFGLSVDDKLIAKELGVTLDELNNLLSEVSIFSVVSLDEKLGEDNNLNISSNNIDSLPETKYVNEESKVILKQTVDKLPERERLIISLYYYNELTYKEISNIIGVSESRVSQLHTKAIIKLKSSLNTLYG